MSDPGAGGTVARRGRRRRGGDVTSGRLREREMEKAAEESRKRRALVEKSVRETRMARLAEMGDVARLLEVEKEVEEVKRSVGDVKRRIGGLMFPEDGEEGVEALEREKEEMRDKVEDLEAVREQMREELGEGELAFALFSVCSH